ncbi:unnamed protein product [Discosporangium mesarthrocarpum]
MLSQRTDRWYTSDEALLILLLRLRFSNRVDNVPHRMGKEYSQMGRGVEAMVNVLMQKFGRIPTNGIGVWTTYFERVTSVIRAKTGMQAHQDKGRICCFVDGTLSPHCAQLGDVEEGATYSGYKRNHGMKFEGVFPPNGIIADFVGPVVGRRHDGYLMRRSSLNARLREAQVGNPVQYHAYGDTAYAVLSNVKRGFKNWAAGLSETQTVENENMSV